MEVEVKLRLLSSAAQEHLSAVLPTHHRQTHLQENIFFDGPNSELSSNLAALRLRFCDLDSRCMLSLKSKPKISAGISRIEEQEEPFDPITARQCAAEPWRLLRFDSSSDIIRRVKEDFKVTEDKGLLYLGGFRNVRSFYEWNGLKLELDETQYDFGTCYEIEFESEEPEIAKYFLEGLLKNNGIEYKYSESRNFPYCELGNYLSKGSRDTAVPFHI